MDIEKNEKVEREKRNIERTTKIFAVIATITLLIILFVIKWNYPAFPLVWVIIIAVFLLAAGGIGFFIFSIVKRFKKDDDVIKGQEKLPKQASLGELQKMAEDALTNKTFANHTVGCDGYQFHTVGKHTKNTVFEYHSHTLYGNFPVVILINTHFPIDKKSILLPPDSTNRGAITRAINALGTDPTDEPVVEIIERENPLLGTREKTTKTKPAEDKEAVEAKKAGDVE